MKIGPIKVEYTPKYAGDKKRCEELLAEITKLVEVQRTIASPGWKITADWARSQVKRWDMQLADMTGDLESNDRRIKVLKRRRDGLHDWMMLFNAVSSLPNMQQELQEIEERQEE